MELQSGWLALVRKLWSESGSRAQSACSPIDVWLDSSLSIQIGKLEIEISIANMLSWLACFIILFSSMLHCWPSPCQIGMKIYYVSSQSTLCQSLLRSHWNFMMPVWLCTDNLPHRHSQDYNTFVVVLKNSHSIFNDFFALCCLY